MPGQAILDLPVFDFEAYLGDAAKLHAECIENYGLAGMAPHPDAAFHLSASLWRYATGQTLAQTAGLSAFFLKALSEFVASRRRHEAARTQGARGRTLREAEEDLGYARRDLDDLTRHSLEIVRRMLDQMRSNRAAARRVIEENLRAISEPDWARNLERLCRAWLSQDLSRIDWTGDTDEALDALDDIASSLPAERGGNGSGRHAALQPVDARLMERMQTELREYQQIASQASLRLKQIDRERRELEAMLAQSSRAAERPVVRDDRDDIEDSVAQAAARRAMADSELEITRLREENRRLREDAERLSAELVNALAQATEGEGQAEELLDRIEEVNSQRLEAAAAIEQLSSRLGRAHQDSAKEAGRVAELEAQQRRLRDDLATAQVNVLQSAEKIRGLEAKAARNADFESALTQSETRLAQTEDRLVESQARNEQLAGEFKDARLRLGQLESRLVAGARTVDTLSARLKESELEGAESHRHALTLERELETLRREHAQWQARVNDSRGDIESALERERLARAESERLREELKTERDRAEKFRVETGRVADELKTAKQRAEKAEAEATSARRRADTANLRLEGRAAEAEAALKQVHADLETLHKQLAASESSARQTNVAAAAELSAAKVEAARLASELDSMRRSEGSSGESAARLRAELAQAHTELSASREQAAAQLNLLNEKLQGADEKLALAAERARNAELERKALSDALEAAERARAGERRDFEARVARLKQEAAGVGTARKETESLKAKLNDADAFLITREREMEKLAAQHKALLAGCDALAPVVKDLQGAPESARAELAAKAAKKIQELLTLAGKTSSTRKTSKRVTGSIKRGTGKVTARIKEKGDTASRRKRTDAQS